MSMTKRAWIISTLTHYVVESNGNIFNYNVQPTERNGYTNIKNAKAQLYRAKRMLHDDTLVVTTI